MMGWYKDLHLGTSFMAFHAGIKGLNAVLKRMRCHSTGGGGMFRKNILTYIVVQRGVLQAQNQVEEIAIVMKNDCNQYSILEI